MKLYGEGSAISLAAFNLAISSAESAQPALPRFSSNCTSVRAPMMGAVTPGCCSSQLRATCAGVLPRAAATSTQGVDYLPGAFGLALFGQVIPPVRTAHAAFRLWRLASAVLAAQPSAGQGRPADDADPLCAAEGQQLPLRAAHQQAVLRLQAVEARPAVHLAEHDGTGQLGRRVVRCADVAHLAGTRTRSSRVRSVSSSGVDASQQCIWYRST